MDRKYRYGWTGEAGWEEKMKAEWEGKRRGARKKQGKKGRGRWYERERERKKKNNTDESEDINYTAKKGSHICMQLPAQLYISS